MSTPSKPRKKRSTATITFKDAPDGRVSITITIKGFEESPAAQCALQAFSRIIDVEVKK